MNFYKRHLGDYAKDAAHLSMLEHGAYTLLLDRYYTTEQPIPLGEAYRVCRARSRDEKAAVDAVLLEFFGLDVDVYRSKRCDEEIARADAQADTNRKIAADREARKRERIQHESSARLVNESSNATLNDSLTNGQPIQTPDTRLQTPDKEKKPSVSAQRASRLPNDWDPGETGNAFAAQQGLRNGRASAELEKFRDYWCAQPGQKGVKADWQATWRNWVRKAAETPASKTSADTGLFEGAR